MKKCSQELIDFLHTAKEFHMCDLYEFELKNGIILRYADYDIDLQIDGNTFLSNGPNFIRNRISIKLGTEVDSMNINIHSNDTDSVGSKTFLQAAHIGAFDEGQLRLYHCYMSNPGDVVGTLEQFSGEIEVKNGGGINLSIEVKSSVQRLNVNYPLRNYYVECPYSVYSKECGIKVDNFKTIGTVINNSTANVINTNIALTPNYYENGGIVFTSGILNGVTMPIKSNSSNSLILMIEAVGTPAAGDTFYIYPGCNKTNTMCTQRFNNARRNRSTPFVPLPEAVV